MFFPVTRPKHCPGNVQSSLSPNMLVKCSHFLIAMSTSQISKHLPYDISEYQKKDKVRMKEAINFTKQLIMEDDNDDYENECDEKYIFYISTTC